MAFDHKHYVPILKTKAGEKWALAQIPITDRPGITPLLEIHAHKTKSHADHSDETCEDLASIWPDDAFLDGIWLHGEQGDPAVIDSVFTCARTHGMLATPVARLTFNPASRSAVATVAATDGRGCMLRVTPGELNYAGLVPAFVSDLGLTPDKVDLLIDYRGRSMATLAADMAAVPAPASWRTLTAASGIFPASLSTLTLGVWTPLDRDCWTTWETAVTSGSLSRRPTFADYAIRDPGAAPEFGMPSVAFRYTADSAWMNRVDGPVKGGGAVRSHAVCADLIGRPFFSGATFSPGDAEIAACAGRAVNPGSAQSWIQWCENHHIVFTSRQIQGHPAL